MVTELVETSPFTADDVARAVLAGLDAGEELILPDPMARAAYRAEGRRPPGVRRAAAAPGSPSRRARSRTGDAGRIAIRQQTPRHRAFLRHRGPMTGGFEEWATARTPWLLAFASAIVDDEQQADAAVSRALSRIRPMWDRSAATTPTSRGAARWCAPARLRGGRPSSSGCSRTAPTPRSRRSSTAPRLRRGVMCSVVWRRPRSAGPPTRSPCASSSPHVLVPRPRSC